MSRSNGTFPKFHLPTEFKIFPVRPLQQYPQVHLANMSIAVVEINYTFL